MDTELKPGTGIYIKSDSARIIKALAQRRYSDLTMQEFNALRMAVHDDSEGEAELPRSPYHDALSLIHRREISTAAIAAALGHHGPNGAEGNVWSLYDQRHRTRRSEPVAPETAESDSAEDTWGDGEEDFPTRLRPIGLEIAPTDKDSLAAADDDILIDDATGRIYVNWNGVAYVAGIKMREIRRWLQKLGPARALYDLKELEDFLERQRAVPVKISRIPRELLIMALGNIAVYRAKLKRRQETERPNLSAEAEAVRAAAILEGVAAKIGWSEIERLTNLIHIPGLRRPS